MFFVKSLARIVSKLGAANQGDFPIDGHPLIIGIQLVKPVDGEAESLALFVFQWDAERLFGVKPTAV